jgi:hypothetical protein
MNNIIYAAENLICPWGRDDVNLNGRKLSVNEKSWFAMMILTRQATVTDLKRKYRLCSRRLWEYARTMKQGKLLRENGGRPKALDEISYEACRVRARQEPQLIGKELYNFLQAEYINSLKRRFPGRQADDPLFHKVMSRSTFKKYKALWYRAVDDNSKSIYVIRTYNQIENVFNILFYSIL